MNPASGGYMGQGLGFIHKIDTQQLSEANSTSFYSNNTSNVSNNLSNSRYMINRRENMINLTGEKAQKSQQVSQIGKIIPQFS